MYYLIMSKQTFFNNIILISIKKKLFIYLFKQLPTHQLSLPMT
jgi:hypothetical protein